VVPYPCYNVENISWEGTHLGKIFLERRGNRMVCGNEYRWNVASEGDGTVLFPLRPSTSFVKERYIQFPCLEH